MKKEDLHRELDLFLIFAIFFIIIFIFIYPTITSLVVYSSTTYNFTFENSNNYIYDSNLISIENNEAKLKLQESTYTWTTINVSEIYATSAYYNGNDKTEKIIALDDKKQLVEKEKTFDITFQNNLQNNDILSLYINEEKKSLVYLCDLATFCDNNYGSVYFPNTAGWYNITIQNLTSTNTLSILTNNSIRINYIKVIRETEQLNSETNYSYPEASSLETNTIDLPNTNQNILFSKNENLNQQEIEYYYSTDDGITWNDLENLSSLEKIKIKAEFKSNNSETPILYNMMLSYEFCEESWNCTDWSDCQENNTKSRTCLDINECNTFELKPTEIQNCVYTPYCEENWTCTDWSNCIDTNQTRACDDFNFCNTTINKPEEIQNCTIQETSTAATTSSSGGGGGSSGSSSTFTRPIQTTEIVTEETKPIETSTTKEEKQEITPTIEAPEIETKTPLQKFTGFVTYNIGKEGFNITLITIILSLIALLTIKSKKIKHKL